jgi:hypothetical protein
LRIDPVDVRAAAVARLGFLEERPRQRVLRGDRFEKTTSRTLSPLSASSTLMKPAVRSSPVGT